MRPVSPYYTQRNPPRAQRTERVYFYLSFFLPCVYLCQSVLACDLLQKTAKKFGENAGKGYKPVTGHRPRVDGIISMKYTNRKGREMG